MQPITNYHIILASTSPRRQQLLGSLGISFEVRTKEIEENYPPHIHREEVALYLSKLKASAFKEELKEHELIITSDTIVCIDNKIIGKPANRAHAIDMLTTLSGNKHEVITAVTLTSATKQTSFFVCTEVFFKPLSLEEITYYVDNFKPFDKAGGYGIQEWIGFVGIEKIVGSYYNVMGLPLKELYEALKSF